MSIHRHQVAGRRKLLGRSIGLALLTLTAGPYTYAQEGAGDIQEIAVTGSRISRSGMETAVPVTAVQMDEMETLAPGTLIEAMNQLPQFLNNSTPQNVGSATGPLGASNLNLRGVGSNRTLVLLNGKRVAASSKLGVPDISTFPESMIKNVEIVTGGASAAYGSDAISGVVNYILDTDFEGVRGHAQTGVTSRGDNENYEAGISFGSQITERSHFLFSADHYTADGINSFNGRDWYDNWGTVDINGPGQPSVVARDVRSRMYTAGGLVRLPGSALDMIHFTEGGVLRQFADGDLVGETRQSGGTGFYDDIGSKAEDQGALGGLMPDTERSSVFMYLDYDFSQDWTGFAQYMYGSNEIDYQQTGAHQESDQWGITVYRENAYLPDSIAAIMDEEGLESFPLYRYASQKDLSRARGNQQNDSHSFTLGLDGYVNDINIKSYYQYGRTDSTLTAKDYARLDRLYKAMDTQVDPETGAVVCTSALTVGDTGCVPANPFGAGSMSAEAIDYILEGDMYRTSELEQHFAEIVADTEIFDGWQAGPIGIAMGMSYRKDSFDQKSGPDDLVALDVLPAEEAGYRGLPNSFVGSDSILQFSGINDGRVGGEFDVWEAFAETLVPLVRDVTMVQALDLNAAYRYADYSGSGGVDAWKVGLDWRLDDNIRFRVTRSRDTRAATLAERFDQSRGGTTAYDPVLDETYSFTQIVGGNPNVDPELADTWTAGVVLTPGFLPDFALSIDWYDIKINDYISQLGVQRIIDDCYAGATDLCQQIARDPDNGQLSQVSNVFLNVAQARVSGVDIEASYSTPVSLFAEGGEELGFRLFGSYLGENSFSNQGVEPRDDAGTTNYPEWTATLMVNYSLDRFRATLSGRYIDSRVQYSDPVSPNNQMDDDSVSSVFYLNTRLDYDFDSGSLGNVNVFLNVANLLDRDPPRVASWSDFFGASSTVPGLHDPLGRRFTVGFNFDY